VPFLRRLRRRPAHRSHAGADLRVDQRGIPTHACLNCGCNVFVVHAMFEDYDIAGWYVDAECSCCGSPLTAPCPADSPLEGG
jgi:hypothetical protein